MILIKLILIFGLSHGYESCEEKLAQVKWPLDCFLALTLKKTRPRSKPYELLDRWCHIYEDKLVQIDPPKPLFSVFLPKKCEQIAIRAQNHHMRIKLIEGNFLNSFL